MTEDFSGVISQTGHISPYIIWVPVAGGLMLGETALLQHWTSEVTPTASRAHRFSVMSS